MALGIFIDYCGYLVYTNYMGSHNSHFSMDETMTGAVTFLAFFCFVGFIVGLVELQKTREHELKMKELELKKERSILQATEEALEAANRVAEQARELRISVEKLVAEHERLVEDHRKLSDAVWNGEMEQ